LLLFYLFVAKFEKMTPPPRSAEEAD